MNKVETQNSPVNITVYKWAGSWGPFSIKIPCGECALTKDIIEDTLNTELKGIDVSLEMKNWLDEWWKPLMRLGWHAPIVLVEGKLVSQGEALNRGVLTQTVIDSYCGRSELSGSHVFGKLSCPHCTRAKSLLDSAGKEYHYHDVVQSPKALYEMLGRVKPIIGPVTPVTVPQIWLDGKYIGGADSLEKSMEK